MKKIVIPLILLLLLFSCGRDEKMLFHSGNNDIVETCLLDNKFTIFCYIDSTNCTTCALQWVHRWTHFEKMLKEMKTTVVLIINNSDEEAVHNAMMHSNLDFPIIFDKNSNIKQVNRPLLHQGSALTVNKKKEIIWVGLPIESEESWNLFRKTLRRESKWYLF